jgi:hypothetical protein
MSHHKFSHALESNSNQNSFPPKTLNQIAEHIAAYCDAELNHKPQATSTFHHMSRWFKGFNPKPRLRTILKKSPPLGLLTPSTPNHHDENAVRNDLMEEVALDGRVRGRMTELAQAMKCDSVGIAEIAC